ncbi:hypothetical protein ES703_101706 [subsurface metagenome]
MLQLRPAFGGAHPLHQLPWGVPIYLEKVGGGSEAIGEGLAVAGDVYSSLPGLLQHSYLHYGVA